MSFRVPEKFRVRTGPLASTAAIGNAGAFDIRLPHSQRLDARPARAERGLKLPEILPCQTCFLTPGPRGPSED